VPLLLVLIATLLLVSPLGEFPLNDDWVYAKAVQDVLETGEYHGHPYSDALFVAQAYWGAAFCKIFGFSFTTLRFSTLVAALIAAWAAAAAARELGVSRNTSLLAGVLFLGNPIILNLSYTFMTDVPFMALANLSLLCFIKSIRNISLRYILLGSAFAALAYLIRQFAVLLPATFIMAYILLVLRRRVPIRWLVIPAMILPWGLAYWFTTTLPATGEGLGMAWNWHDLGWNLRVRTWNGFRHFFMETSYLAWFLLPISGLIVYERFTHRGRGTGKMWLRFVVLILMAAWALDWHEGRHMPYIGNMLFDLGVGPMLLRGIVVGYKIEAPMQIGSLWWGITVLGLLGAAALVLKKITSGYSVFKTTRHPLSKIGIQEHQQLFVYLMAIASVLVLFNPGLPALYDRYFVMAVTPWCILGLRGIAWEKKGRVAVAWFGAVCVYVFSLVCLQDYMAWNTTRWEALSVLEKKYEIAPEEIDGGYEFNGLYTSDYYFKDKTSSNRRVYGPKGWWVIEDTYAVSFVERKNFEVLETLYYHSWLGWATRPIYILHRTADDEEPWLN